MDVADSAESQSGKRQTWVGLEVRCIEGVKEKFPLSKYFPHITVSLNFNL